MKTRSKSGMSSLVACGWILALVSCGSTAAPAAPCPTVVVDQAPPDPSVRNSEGACAQGDYAACEAASAMYRLGVGAPREEGKAETLGRRALELRLAACARGDEAACGGLPASIVPARELVELPGSAATSPATVTLMIRKDGGVFVDGKAVVDLAGDVAAACQGGARAVIAADASASYGSVVQAMDTLKRAGCTKIGFAVHAGR